jgi:pimeloyl-ACP methyl ester carboxylesterase
VTAREIPYSVAETARISGRRPIAHEIPNTTTSMETLPQHGRLRWAMMVPRRQALVGMLAAFGAAGLPTGMRALAQEPRAPSKGAAKPAAKSASAKPWETLPPTPKWPKPDRSGLVLANGARLFYAQFGKGPNVLLLHGGMGSSNHWGHLIRALSPQYAVTALDTRGHGRSPFGPGTFSYKLLADDAAAVLAALDVPSAAVVGWSDGAIAALQMAVSHPAHVKRAFAFGGNITLGGYKANGSSSPVFAAYSRRCRAEYQALSPDPRKWSALVRGLASMWRAEPGIGKPHLAALKIPVTISDGQYDEIIKREHTEMMARSIPGAKLQILPEVSHFAVLQKPDEFNRAVLEFLAA